MTFLKIDLESLSKIGNVNACYLLLYFFLEKKIMLPRHPYLSGICLNLRVKLYRAYMHESN